MRKKGVKSFRSDSKSLLMALLVVAAAVTVYGVAQAVVSHQGSEILGDVAGASVSRDSERLQGLAAVDILAQSEGGIGFPVWMVNGTTLFIGNGEELGGRTGANAKCRAEFGEKAMMFGTQHINCYAAGTCALDIRTPARWSGGWFDLANNRLPGDSGGNTVPIQWDSSSSNCHGWTSRAGGATGYVITGSGDTRQESCSDRRRILCAVLK